MNVNQVVPIVDQPCSGRPVSVTDDKHQKQVDELIKHDRRITQKQIAGRLGMSKGRVGYIIGLLGYTKVCSRWVPRMSTTEKKQNVLKFVKNFCTTSFSASLTNITTLLPQSRDCSCYVSTSTALLAESTMIYTDTISRTLPTCNIILGSLTLHEPEAGDFTELILPHSSIRSSLCHFMKRMVCFTLRPFNPWENITGTRRIGGLEEPRTGLGAFYKR